MKSHTARILCSRLTISAVLLMGISAPAFAQSADDKNAEEYSALLERIANLKMSLNQKEAYIESQKAEIASLEAQITESEAVTKSVGPMLSKMAAAIEDEMNADLPFKPRERFERLSDFQQALGEEDVAPAEKMRKALNIYNVEVNYGQSLEAYPGNHPVAAKAGSRYAACEADAQSTACGLSKKQGEDLLAGATIADLKDGLMDGDYLRYGRVALVYLQNDASEAYRYDQPSKAWEPLSGGKILEVRRAVRIAKGEAAPGVVTAPVYVAGE